MNHQSRHRAIRSLVGVLSLASLPSQGCEPAPPDPAALAASQVFGHAAEGGDAAAGEAWQAALEAWPSEGRLEMLYGDQAVQGQMDAWMMGQIPPQPLPELGRPVMERIRAFNDQLIALDGGWGPVPAPARIRDMSVRGMRKTLWADVRCAVAEREVDRLVDVLVVMATLPRVSHAYDASMRGLIATIGLMDGLAWALRDAATPQYEIEFDAAQCARLRAATAWIDRGDAFGTPDPEDARRLAALAQYEAKTLTQIRELLAVHCR